VRTPSLSVASASTTAAPADACANFILERAPPGHHDRRGGRRTRSGGGGTARSEGANPRGGSPLRRRSTSPRAR
jgi:hypothetical protein